MHARIVGTDEPAQQLLNLAHRRGVRVAGVAAHRLGQSGEHVCRHRSRARDHQERIGHRGEF
jgi:hypothetical protein